MKGQQLELSIIALFERFYGTYAVVSSMFIVISTAYGCIRVSNSVHYGCSVCHRTKLKIESELSKQR